MYCRHSLRYTYYGIKLQEKSRSVTFYPPTLTRNTCQAKEKKRTSILFRWCSPFYGEEVIYACCCGWGVCALRHGIQMSMEAIFGLSPSYIQWFTLAPWHTKEGDEITMFLVPCLQDSISTPSGSFWAIFFAVQIVLVSMITITIILSLSVFSLQRTRIFRTHG